MPARPPPPPATDTFTFQPDRALLLPKFESYKLTFPRLDRPVSSEPLPRPFTTASNAVGERHSFEEVRYRAGYNHLSKGAQGSAASREVAWVSHDGRVTAARIDPVTATPTFFDVVRLSPPPPSSSSSRAPLAPEYASVHCLSPSTWVVSDGRETVHVVSVDPASLEGTVVASYRVDGRESVRGKPLRLHRADLVSSSRVGAGVGRNEGQEGADHDDISLFLSVSVKSGPGATVSDATAATGDPIDSDTPKLGVPNSRLKIPSSTTFEYFSLRIPLPSPSSPPSQSIGQTDPTESTAVKVELVEPEFVVQGLELPSFVSYDRATNRYFVGTPSGLRPIDPPGRPTPSPTDIVSHPAPEPSSKSSDARADPSTASPTPRDPRAVTVSKPRPFSWTQDKSSLTVAFPIPSDTPTSSIRITFSRLFLTLHIGSASSVVKGTSSSSSPGPTAQPRQSHAFELPRISHKKWWAEIDPHTSVWTFDREAEGRDSTFGILTLHLEKRFEGTKWSDVFETTTTKDDADRDVEMDGTGRLGGRGGGDGGKIREMGEGEEYEGVPETVDPSELAKISEDFEKWTRGIMEGGGVAASQEGLGHGVPTSLMGDEMDVEVDAEGGRGFVVSWIDARGGGRGETRHEAGRECRPDENVETRSTKQATQVHTPHPTIPYSILSTALPLVGATATDSAPDQTITIKHDVDGLVFSPPTDRTPHPPSTDNTPGARRRNPFEWTHTSTFPALAFVLATKRDTKFIHHLSSRCVLAFDSPSILSNASASSDPSSSSERSVTTASAGNLFIYLAPEPRGALKGKQMVIKLGTAGRSTGQLMGVAGVELEGGEVAVVALCENELLVIRFQE
ncbi:hypothetical protein JCM10212_004288 [Sporobolomyces blumeae]